MLTYLHDRKFHIRKGTKLIKAFEAVWAESACGYAIQFDKQSTTWSWCLKCLKATKWKVGVPVATSKRRSGASVCKVVVRKLEPPLTFAQPLE